MKEIDIQDKLREKIDTKDGIRIDFSDKWALVRMSNTEPVIRIFAEAKSKREAHELISKIKKYLKGIKK